MSADTRRFQDVLTRHQIYLEGVKVYYARGFTRTLQLLIVELRKLFARIDSQTLDQLTKAQVYAFIRDLRRLQSEHYDRYVIELTDELQAFMAVDLAVNKAVFSALARKGEESEDDDETILLREFNSVQRESGEGDSSIVPLAFLLGNKKANDSLWSSLINAPIPALGVLPLVFLKEFASSANDRIAKLILKAYANKATTADALRSIVGTPKLAYRDGALNVVNRQGGAVVDTLLQHISGIVGAGVSSVFYKRYQWISIIDSATTPICRERNRRIYVYGKGPLPPAHVGCRSKPVPYVGEARAMTYAEWLNEQPLNVRADIKNSERFNTLDVKPLSPDQFKRKLPLILAA